jgi:hypothetical protein
MKNIPLRKIGVRRIERTWGITVEKEDVNTLERIESKIREATRAKLLT